MHFGGVKLLANDIYFRSHGQVPSIFEKENLYSFYSVLEKSFRCHSDSIVGKNFKLGIKENIYRIMKDCLVSLFVSVVGRAPFDAVKGGHFDH